MLYFTADNHLGIESQWSLRERGRDFELAFKEVVGDIVDTAPRHSALILGGDTFDKPNPSASAIEFLQREVSKLADAGVEVYGIDGNHDPADGGWLRVCGVTPLSDEPVDVDGNKVCGLNHARADKIVEALEEMVARGVKCDVLVLHLSLAELNMMGGSSDLSAKDILPMLKDMGVRLVLMGHIHIRQSVTVDGVTFAYCGSTEMCSINEPREKSFEKISPDLSMTASVIKTRDIVDVRIDSEEDLAKFIYESCVSNVDGGKPRDTDGMMFSAYVSSEVKDGVKRVREVAAKSGAMVRIQSVQVNQGADGTTGGLADAPELDRTTGVIGLESAIEASFKPDSDEARLIRAFLRTPTAVKLAVDEFLKGR